MSVELTITIKGEEKKKLTDSYLLDDFETPLTMDRNDPIILSHVNKLLEEFQGTPEDIIIKTTMVWK